MKKETKIKKKKKLCAKRIQCLSKLRFNLFSALGFFVKDYGWGEMEHNVALEQVRLMRFMDCYLHRKWYPCKMLTQLNGRRKPAITDVSRNTSAANQNLGTWRRRTFQQCYIVSSKTVTTGRPTPLLYALFATQLPSMLMNGRVGISRRRAKCRSG